MQVLRFISGADPDPRTASASASSASPADPPSTVDASTDAFPPFPMARAWIGALYRDLHCPPATLHSLDPAYFADLNSCLDDGMLFVKVPSGTAIPIGSKLLEARHIQ